MSTLNVAAYGEGIMYPPNLAPNIQAIQTAGWTSIILGLFHVNSAGDIYFNDTQLVTGGNYVGSQDWPSQLQQLLQGQGSTITTLLASIGGGGVADFANIQAIYQANGNSFANTPLQANFQTFFSTFPMITLIDMDVEEGYDPNSFVAFCQMLIQIGFGITFCPYTYTSFWTGALAQLNNSNPGAVEWWNLQCYDGGAGNDPAQWAQAITQAIPGFNTAGFIVAGDWTNDCPPQVQKLMASFADETCVGGGFIWTLDQILENRTNCGNVTMSDYVAAIVNGLSSKANKKALSARGEVVSSR